MKYFIKIVLVVFVLANTAFASLEEPTQEEVAKLYVATFNRAPDAAGLEYWVNSGLNLQEIAQSFFDQPETQTLYPPETTNREFVKAVYQNLFNRDPDLAGWDYWEKELNENRFSKNSFILAVINGALGDDATILSNKTEVGLAYADKGNNDEIYAKVVLEGITADPDRVKYIKDKISSNQITYDTWKDFTVTISGEYDRVVFYTKISSRKFSFYKNMFDDYPNFGSKFGKGSCSQLSGNYQHLNTSIQNGVVVHLYVNFDNTDQECREVDYTDADESKGVTIGDINAVLYYDEKE